jgi:hypothetical protein
VAVRLNGCCDRVFPGAVGCNVAGSLEPERAVKQKIVLRVPLDPAGVAAEGEGVVPMPS